jgi:hypothetical protein
VQSPITDIARSLCKGDYLGVGSGVCQQFSLIVRFGNYSVLVDYDRTYRDIAFFSGDASLVDS